VRFVTTEVKGKLEITWMFATVSPALGVYPEWNQRHESNYPLSNRHLHRNSDDMGVRDFFCRPLRHRRARSRAQSVANSIAGSQVNLGTSPQSEPDLRIGSSILPTSALSTSQNQGPNGMWMATLGEICLTFSTQCRHHYS